MYSRDAVDQSFKIKDFKEIVSYKKEFYKENPTYFNSDGLICFIGSQGTGKTLSAVRYCCNLLKLYPKLKFVSNIQVSDFPIITFEEFLKKRYNKKVFLDYETLSPGMQKALKNDYYAINRVFPFRNADDLKRYNNYDEGVLYLIDEIQLYFNSLESKNVSMDVMAEISQQRKQRKHIVCTSQVFGRLAKPLREQFNSIVKCSCLLNCFQLNYYYKAEDLESDGDYMHFKGPKDKLSFFFHSPHDYKNYDTYYKIQDLDPTNKGGLLYESSSDRGC